MNKGHLIQMILNFSNYAKRLDIPFLAIIDDKKTCYCDKIETSKSFALMAILVGLTNKGQITDEFESTLHEYSIISSSNVNGILDTTGDVVECLNNMLKQILIYIVDSKWDGPWVLSYEIIVDDIVVRKTISGMISFTNYPAHNIIQYIAVYPNIKKAAQQFTNIEFDDIDKTDYKLFNKYLA